MHSNRTQKSNVYRTRFHKGTISISIWLGLVIKTLLLEFGIFGSWCMYALCRTQWQWFKNPPKKSLPMQSKRTFNSWKYQVHTSTHEIVNYASSPTWASKLFESTTEMSRNASLKTPHNLHKQDKVVGLYAVTFLNWIPVFCFRSDLQCLWSRMDSKQTCVTLSWDYVPSFMEFIEWI